MAVSRIASTDTGYSAGDLSLYPGAKDSKYQLYEAKNNCQTVLKQSLTYTAKYVVVEDNSLFPNNGMIRIGPPPGVEGPAEIVYYDTKTNGIFRNLIRGFAGSRQNPWPVGSVVSNAVFAEHHNSVKDAIIQIERNLGTSNLPDPLSLNGILEIQETRFLSPKPLFRAYPTKGPPQLKVRFQNFSTGPTVRYLWDFGDGTTSVEKSPIHTYTKEGIYTVQLNIITSLGAQGVVTKTNYITVSNQEKQPFFYATPYTGISAQTAASLNVDPTVFSFVDQTDGDIIQRYWIFDGPGKNNNVEAPTQSVPEYNPNIHTSNYVYDIPGIYEPSLLILFESQTLTRAFLRDKITVI
jgi:PKD repeat protein